MKGSNLQRSTVRYRHVGFNEPYRHEQRSSIIRISNNTTVDYLYKVDGKADQLENQLSSVAKVCRTMVFTVTEADNYRSHLGDNRLDASDCEETLVSVYIHSLGWIASRLVLSSRTIFDRWIVLSVDANVDDDDQMYYATSNSIEYDLMSNTNV